MLLEWKICSLYFLLKWSKFFSKHGSWVKNKSAIIILGSNICLYNTPQTFFHYSFPQYFPYSQHINLILCLCSIIISIFSIHSESFPLNLFSLHHIYPMSLLPLYFKSLPLTQSPLLLSFHNQTFEKANLSPLM